jgi:flagellum-specific peptidoglycan hydrolase FlgJ
VTVSTGGVITGFTFAPGATATMTSPTSLPVHLLALDRAAGHGHSHAEDGDGALRPAIVNVANYYLKLANSRTPAQVEALIWGKTSLDGADHGPSCAAFASLTLELAAQAVGQQSWVTGGSSYPWPLHGWADPRVDPNPASLGITSIVQDAEAHHRWHAPGDGYRPQPGDWVLFEGHVEVVTGYSHGVLDTIGADSLPNYSVNAHSYADPLNDEGVTGFVDNGNLAPAGAAPAPAPKAAPGHTATPGRTGTPGRTATPEHTTAGDAHAPDAARQPVQRGQAAIPGLIAPGNAAPKNSAPQNAAAAKTRAPASRSSARHRAAGNQAANIPGDLAPLTAPAASAPAHSAPTASAPAGSAAKSPHQRHSPATPGATPSGTPEAIAQQRFISEIAPGAIAAQREYGVPASVTIAQAIDESGWGQSLLATRDHNLFGIKGTGPAGADTQPTREYVDGHWVTASAHFRVYHDIAESITDHARLLATSGYYAHAMADRAVPDAFADDLTGVYATDPGYGAHLVALMRLYNLYRYDSATTMPHAPASTPREAPPSRQRDSQRDSQAAPGGARIPGLVAPAAPTNQARAAQANATHAKATHANATQTNAARAQAPRSRHQAPRYRPQLPATVATAYFTTAKAQIARGEPLYRDVASQMGTSWKLLAACDWMQCQAQPRYSPVHGEKLGAVNEDGTAYFTKSEALAQCASDLIGLSWTVYRINLTAPRPLSVCSLAEAFTAFRWGTLLKRHGVSAMEFPYSVAGLTEGHLKMHWPAINEPDAPDKPGGKFRMTFGAVPVVLSLNYPATV